MIKQDCINQIFVSNGNHCPCDLKGNMFQGGTSVVVPYCYLFLLSCPYLYFGSTIMLVTYFSKF